MKICLQLLITMFILLASNTLFAQNDKEKQEEVNYEVRLKTGERIIGRILSSDKTTMQMVKVSGDTLTLLKSEIDTLRQTKAKSRKQLTKKADLLKEIRSSDYSRYFYTSPSFTIEKKKVAAMTQGFSYSNLTYGVTDNLSLEVGSSFTGLLFQIPIIAITPKIRILDSKSIKLSSYVSYITTLPNPENNNASVVLFGFTTTRGDETKNVSFGISGGFVDGRFLNLPLFQISAANYISPRTALIFDSQIVSFGQLFNDDIGLIYNAMPGVRLMRKTFSIDLAVAVFGVTVDDENSVIALPYVGYNLYLSKM
ncbi:MAG: hypothetical protein WBA74_17415 [Cyclobacteriaceae bacterium]